MAKRKFLTLLIVALLPLFAFAQNKVKVSGKVTDNFGTPIPGATVMISGTTTGTITDQDGQYTLEAPSDGSLVAQFIGFDPEELLVNNQTTINFMLFESNTELEELVVIGYGTMKKKDVTSSITTVTAEDLNRGVYTDPGSMLQGKVAGLVVTSSGDPNGTPSITLRGSSSLRSGAMSPYYVVDGIPGVDISMVAPDDIESIDVLRDATATAIYGSKAANGVIIITTKSGGATERTNV
ncbi:MAG: TonB-dependent receptor plug domain-containing protein, partial [Bacteroidales bacterium]|nr:TonB-dependent receptor plug domain-containing protein [Bacteroidales bacterium]